MPLFWFAFFLGFAIVAARVIVGDAVAVQFDVSTLLLALGVALPIGAPDSGADRHRAVSRTAALLAAAGVVLVALCLAIGSAVPAVVTLLASCVMMFGLGRCVTPFLLYVGVQKVKRLHLAAACVSGGACGYAMTNFLIAPHVPAAGALAIATLPLLVLALASGARAADMPAPERESPRVGLASLLGTLLVGMGLFALYRSAAVRSNVSFIDPRAQAAFFSWPLAILAIGAWVLPVKNPRSRRAAFLLGAGALFAVAAYGFEVFYVGDIASGPERTAFLARVGVTDESGLADEARLGVALLGAPSLLIGVGLATIARFYAGLPMGRKLVRHLPPSERRALSGAPLRAAAFVLGIPLADGLIARGRLGQHGALCLLAAGGVLLLWSDPRAGLGRKLGLGSIAGFLAALGLWLAW